MPDENRFIAKVIDNDDSNHSDGLNEGRIQFVIEQLHHGLSPSLYPWARQDGEATSKQGS